MVQRCDQLKLICQAGGNAINRTRGLYSRGQNSLKFNNKKLYFALSILFVSKYLSRFKHH